MAQSRVWISAVFGTSGQAIRGSWQKVPCTTRNVTASWSEKIIKSYAYFCPSKSPEDDKLHVHSRCPKWKMNEPLRGPFGISMLQVHYSSQGDHLQSTVQTRDLNCRWLVIYCTARAPFFSQQHRWYLWNRLETEQYRWLTDQYVPMALGFTVCIAEYVILARLNPCSRTSRRPGGDGPTAGRQYAIALACKGHATLSCLLYSI